MTKHIVVWTLNEPEKGKTKAQVAAEMKRVLEGLNGKIKGLVRLEVGADLTPGEGHADVTLYSEFTDEAALKGYIEHPEHVEAAKFVRPLCGGRMVADYKV